MAKVLVIRTSSFGDVAMLVPVIYSVASKYPQDRFSILTRTSFAPLFKNLNFNVNVIPFDPGKSHKGPLGLIRLTCSLIGKRFTHVADEHDVLRSKIIRSFLLITGTRIAKLDKGRKEKEDAISLKNMDIALKPTIQRYFETFEALGFKADMIYSNYFEFVYRDPTKLKHLATEKQGKWVGIAPFAKHQGKIYPEQKMERVVEKLSSDKNITVFLFGAGKKEKEALDSWSEKYPNVVNVTGQLKLDRELLMMSYIDVMLTMDSANMHLASLVETPVVSIWGATHPNLGFYGFRQDPENAIQVDLACRPCSVYGNLPCTNKEQYACMNQISEETVVNKIYKVLESK